MSNTPNLKLNILNDSGNQIFYVNQTTGINSTLTSTYTNTTTSTNSSSASFVLYGGLSLANTSDSVSYTEGGALTLAGGISVAKTMYVGTNVYTPRISAGNIISTNMSAGIMNIGNLTTGNINLTGTLSQNGVPYSSSQWTSTSGNVLIYTAGNVITSSLSSGSLNSLNVTSTNIVGTNVSINSIIITNGGLIATFNSNTIGSIFTTGGNIGINTTIPGYILDVGGDINFSGSLYQNGVLFTSGGGGGGSSQWTTTSGNTITYTSGNVSISGPLSITNTADAVATTSAAVTISGGIGVSKSMVVGSSINVGGVCTEYGGVYTGANGANPSGTTFTTNINFSSSTIRSFTMTINVSVLASSNLYDKYTIEGIYTPNAGWSINDSVIGDNTGITFSIDASGNILFFSPYFSSWSSTTLIYHIFAYTVSGTYNPITMPTTANVILPGTLTIQTTDFATTPSTGALVVSGGVSISKNLYVVDTLFTTNGNVGIDTTSPNYNLDVNGLANITTSLTTGGLYSTNVTTTNIVSTNSSTSNMYSSYASIGTIASTLISATTMTGGNISLSGNLNVAGTLTVVNITSTNLVDTNLSVGTILASTLVSSASIQGTNSTITNAVHTTLSSANAVISSSSGALILGSDSNVINALSSTQLYIVGNRTSTTNVAGIGFQRSFFRQSSMGIDTGNNMNFALQNSADSFIFRNNSADFNQTTSGSTLLTILSSGGISTGTASFTNVSSTNTVITNMTASTSFTTNYRPAYQFSNTATAANNAVLGAFNSTSSSFSVPFMGGTALSNNNAFQMNWNNVSMGNTANSLTMSIYGVGSTPLAIRANGNVGINTPTPVYNLDVSGTMNVSTSLTTGALYSTNSTITNAVHTTLSSANAMFTTSITVPSLLASTSISSGALYSNNLTSTNAMLSNLNPGLVVLIPIFPFVVIIIEPIV